MTIECSECGLSNNNMAAIMIKGIPIPICPECIIKKLKRSRIEIKSIDEYKWDMDKYFKKEDTWL